MHWDMEGTSGLFSREQVWFWEPGVRKYVADQGQSLLIADVNNAVRAALDAGVDAVIVSDTHHGGGNMVADRMLADPRVTYNPRSRGLHKGEFRWMPGLDETVDGFMVPAHHAKAGTANAFLPHTNSSLWTDFSINGQSVGEMGLEACYAAHWGVPLMMTHGDETFIKEARSTYPGIVAVAVKRAIDHDHCTGPAPEVAHKLVAEGIRQAVENLRAGKCVPFAPKLPMTVTIRMKNPADADAAVAKRPDTVLRVDEYTIQGHVERHCDVMAWLSGDGLKMPSPK
jgi:D-amino peptidase